MRYILVLWIILTSILSYTQTPKKVLGVEYNYYPAGHVIGIQGEYSPNNNHHSFNARLGTNITRRWNFSGLNDDERGGGFGGSLGYRYYLTPQCRGLYLGARTDLWFMTVDWQDSSELITQGSTEITVLQPTFEIGYLFHLRNGWELGTAFVNGVELNVRMDGEPVGEGWITLWQLRLSKTLKFKNED